MKKILFPEIKPYDEDYLKVSDIHKIHYQQYGNKNGIPIIWLHGGPGGGCSGQEAGYFDPNFYRIILFDQRGAGKSQPFCELKENNTGELINDIEKLRLHLKIEKLAILGGSWGSLLYHFPLLTTQSLPTNTHNNIKRQILNKLTNCYFQFQ